MGEAAINGLFLALTVKISALKMSVSRFRPFFSIMCNNQVHVQSIYESSVTSEEVMIF